ncbi:hypothetical protein ACWEP1_23570, partial [Streptomyces sp. NPDC004285]
MSADVTTAGGPPGSDTVAAAPAVGGTPGPDTAAAQAVGGTPGPDTAAAQAVGNRPAGRDGWAQPPVPGSGPLLGDPQDHTPLRGTEALGPPPQDLTPVPGAGESTLAPQGPGTEALPPPPQDLTPVPGAGESSLAPQGPGTEALRPPPQDLTPVPGADESSLAPQGFAPGPAPVRGTGSWGTAQTAPHPDAPRRATRDRTEGLLLGIAAGDAAGWPAARHRAARMPEWTRRLTRELDAFAEQNATTTLPVPIALNQPPEPLRLGPSDDAEWAAFTAEAVLAAAGPLFAGLPPERRPRAAVDLAWNALAGQVAAAADRAPEVESAVLPLRARISVRAGLGNLATGLRP